MWRGLLCLAKLHNKSYNKFSEIKAKAIDSVNDALAAAAFDAVQQRKIEFAQSMGFELDDTKAIKAVNQLRMIEDSILVIYRLS